jgi:hypothetical protein
MPVCAAKRHAMDAELGLPKIPSVRQYHKGTLAGVNLTIVDRPVNT